MQLKYALIVCTAVAFAGCKPKLDAEAPDKGNVDATRYVAIGGSSTAGFADGALYYEGQQNSYTNILAKQFELIGGGVFNAPWMAENSVGIGFTGKSKSILGSRTDCKGVVSLGPIAFDIAGGDLNALSANIYASPFNNMGVPSSTSTSIHSTVYGNPANGAGNYNPFFYRMAANPTTSSVLADAVNANPTFFSISLGEQDILNYAMSGGTVPMTPVNGAAGVGFDGSITTAVTTLSANGARGVISNIPDVTLYPYFNTIPWNGLTLDAENATTLSNISIYSELGFVFKEGNNAFVIADPDAPGGIRQIKAGELICLSIPLDSVKCHKWGTITPFPNKYVLTLSEIQEIKNNINQYNNVITQVANTYGLALADIHSLVGKMKTGVVFNGVSMNTTFVSGGAFSLDGVNLNPIGQAMVANVFIKSINRSFGSTLPQVDVTKYRGVKFP